VFGSTAGDSGKIKEPELNSAANKKLPSLRNSSWVIEGAQAGTATVSAFAVACFVCT
jgi:hypothetical protein